MASGVAISSLKRVAQVVMLAKNILVRGMCDMSMINSRFKHRDLDLDLHSLVSSFKTKTNTI